MAYFYIISKLIILIKSMRFYKIPAGSLLPTIMAGDWIVTLKVWSTANLKRRDLIVFPYPPEPSIDYIKRVIGLPGENLEITKDQVFINGAPLDEPYAYFEPKEMTAQLSSVEGLITLKSFFFCGSTHFPLI